MKLILLIALSATAFAKSGGSAKSMRMGGVGYLVPDGNSFANSSQMPMTMGFAIQGMYSTVPATTTSTLSPSAVWGSGKVGIGAWGARSGTSFSDSSQYADTAGGAFGFSFAQNRMSMGVGYGRQTSPGQVNDGTLRADFALNAVKGSGLIFGVGASTTVNALTVRRTATVGVGYQFSVNSAIEGNYAMNDLDNKDDTTFAGYLTWGGRVLYFGGGALYQNLTKVTEGTFRLGLRMGTKIDVSGFTTQTFKSGYNPLYGGTFRLMF